MFGRIRKAQLGPKGLVLSQLTDSSGDLLEGRTGVPILWMRKLRPIEVRRLAWCKKLRASLG